MCEDDIPVVDHFPGNYGGLDGKLIWRFGSLAFLALCNLYLFFDMRLGLGLEA